MTARSIRIEGDAAFVPLTKGYEAVIDVSDVPLVDGVLWRALVAFKANGDVRSVYAVRWDGPKCVLLHRVILDADGDIVSDHIDGDGLNNRRANLRLASNTENIRNSRKRTDNTSGFKGVSWKAKRGKWQAHISVDGKNKYLGLFKCSTAAALAYARASRELHGAFGRTA